jgi:hypothetical protein
MPIGEQNAQQKPADAYSASASAAMSMSAGLPNRTHRTRLASYRDCLVPTASLRRGPPQAAPRPDRKTPKLMRTVRLRLTDDEFGKFEALRFACGHAATESQLAWFMICPGVERRRRKDLPDCVPGWFVRRAG